MRTWHNWIFSSISRKQVNAVYAAVVNQHRAKVPRWVLTDLYELADFKQKTNGAGSDISLYFDKGKEDLAEKIISATFSGDELQSLFNEWVRRYEEERTRRGKALHVLGEMKTSEIYSAHRDNSYSTRYGMI